MVLFSINRNRDFVLVFLFVLGSHDHLVLLHGLSFLSYSGI